MRAGVASSDSTLDTVFREARDSSPKRTVFAPVNKACIEKESKMTDSNATSNLGHILHVWRANGIESRSFPVHCDIHPVQHEDVGMGIDIQGGPESLNKCDRAAFRLGNSTVLCAPLQISEIGAAAPGVDVHVISAATGNGVDALQPYLGPGNTAVLKDSPYKRRR